jgi:hypothetical protein
VNQRYLQNTLEQFIVFVVGLFGLAAYSPDSSVMRAVLATTVVWILARFAFWIGCHRSAAMRGIGAPGMAVSMIVLLYVAGRIRFDLGGVVGATVPVAAFRGISIQGDAPNAHCETLDVEATKVVHPGRWGEAVVTTRSNPTPGSPE